MTLQGPMLQSMATATPVGGDRLVADAKQALRRLAGAVSVIGCRHDGQSQAMTATSVTALSMDPPSMLVCINRAARFHQAIDGAAAFSINVLSRAQTDVSKACSGAARGGERFRVGDWDADGLAPLLKGAQASVLCRKDGEMRYGTHTIFIGRIVSVSFEADVDPLIYLDGSYAGRPLDDLAAVEPLQAWYLL